MHNLKKTFFLITFSFISQIVLCQGNVKECLANLNKIHEQGRLMFGGKSAPEIFLNKESKILDFGPYFLSVDEVEVSYTYQAPDLPNKKYDAVKFLCLQKDCINSADFGKTSNILTFFKSRKYCYDFINAFNELKKALDNFKKVL